MGKTKQKYRTSIKDDGAEMEYVSVFHWEMAGKLLLSHSSVCSLELISMFTFWPIRTGNILCHAISGGVLWWFHCTKPGLLIYLSPTMKRSTVHNSVPTVTKCCVMWEGLSLPHDTIFGNCRGEIVDRRVVFIWSLIHGSSWSGLIKVGLVSARRPNGCLWCGCHDMLRHSNRQLFYYIT